MPAAWADCPKRTVPPPRRGWRREFVPAVVLFVLVIGLPAWSDPPEPPPPPRTELTKEEQARVDQAIQRGTEYLEASQNRDGTWGDKPTHPLGYTALPALTLLESGMPATDTTIRKAAGWVRGNARRFDTTYEIALAILFLDRLKDPDDRALIHTLAMRLVWSQTSTGGWSYKCRALTAQQEQQLTAALWHLQSQRRELMEAPPRLKEGMLLQDVVREPLPRQALDPAGGGSQRSPGEQGEREPGSGGALKGSKPDDLSPPGQKPPAKKPPPEPPRFPGWPAIPEEIKRLPVVRELEALPAKDPEQRPQEPQEGTTDNSNTQFALLAVWTARRHQVPVDRTIALIVKRFRTSQNKDGSWGYRYANGGGDPERPAMTCVGLLGLAVGYGLPVDGGAKNGPPKWALKKPEEDPQVRAGLKALGRSVGQPADRWQEVPQPNLYFLWSVERVGVLYQLKGIEDRAWYRWGAEALVANQHPDGKWDHGQYHGNHRVIDTCLALLFLKKANLADDLTKAVAFTPRRQVLPPQPPEEIHEPTRIEPEPAPPPPPAHVEVQGAAWKTSWTWLFWVIGAVALVGGCLIAYRLASSAEDDGRGRRVRRRPHPAGRPQRARK